MTVAKIINNNIVVSVDAQGRETVAMGRGLGFQRRVGDSFDDALAEKVFTLGTREIATKFQQVAAEIPLEHILLTERIIALAKERFRVELHDSIYVTLPDHISMALERHATGMVLKNPMLLDIKRFYRDEFAIGEQALELVAAATGVRFDADEAGFIAMHFVNAELNGDMSELQALTRTIEGMLSIAKEYLGGLCDEESIAWYRFVTHVKFFAQRLLTDNDYPDEDFELFDILKEKYPDPFGCAQRISDFVAAVHGQAASKEEMAYLTLHIRRLSVRVKR